MAVSESRHKTGDTSVRLRRDGQGERVLFLHGAGGWPVWGAFMQSLAGKYDVLMPEHPGFGISGNPSWIRNVADVAMYYLDFLEALGGPPVHLIGHSLGGWISAELAVRNTARLKSLTLIAPAGVRVKGLPCGDNFIWSPEESARNRFHDQSFADAALAAPPPSDAQVDEALQNALAAVKFGWEPRWFNPDLEKWLHRIDVPTHVVWGREDRLLPSAYARAWGEGIPAVRVTMIAAAGHLPQVEKAEGAAQTVIAFLDRVPA
jgi:pimeloyl-ACP methyl ester carboxylesterase